jgi:hypothetical protein
MNSEGEAEAEGEGECWDPEEYPALEKKNSVNSFLCQDVFNASKLPICAVR